MKKQKLVYNAVILLLAALIIVSAFAITALTKTIRAQRRDVDAASSEVNDLKYELLLKQQEIDNYSSDAANVTAMQEYVSSLIAEREAYMAKFDVFTIFDYDTLINRHMPPEAIKLLENLVLSISTSDEELYKSLFHPGRFTPGSDPDGVAYMMAPFNNNKGKSYIVRQISTYGNDIEFLQKGPYFAVVVAQAENGEYFYHPAVGITLDAELGRWIIYDFD